MSFCLNSIICQTYKNLEIIIVDDGSTDGSGKVCDKYKSKDNRIKVIHKKNGGLSSARNAGLKIAKGEYIGFIDSDDTINSKMYEILLKNALKTDSDISMCSYQYFWDNNTYKIKNKEKLQLVKLDSKEAIIQLNNFSSFDMSACDKLYRRTIFNKIKFPEGRLSEDFFVMYKLFLRAKKICYIALPLYNYRQRKNSISHSTNINFDFIDAAQEQREEVSKIYPELTSLMNVAYASAVLTVYDNFIKQDVKCSNQLKIKFQNDVKKNIKYYKKVSYIPLSKKIQAYLFAISPYVYKLIFKLRQRVI